MPATYTLIASNTLSSSAASVTFSAIPATYTDLVLRYNARVTDATATNAYWCDLKLNGDGAVTTYSTTYLYGDGSTAGSGSFSSAAYGQVIVANGGGSTSNTFSNAEIYFPNYAGSTNKPIGFNGVTEKNAATAPEIEATAILWRNTAAITSIKIECVSSGSTTFVSGSSFFLYGIKNS